MSRFSYLRLHAEVLWIFRIKARLNKCGAKITDDEKLSDMPLKAFQVDKIFREDNYEPHALFNGKVYLRQGQAIDIGKRLNEGLSNAKVARMTGAEPQTVSNIRRAINEYRGKPFMCLCGLVGGHKNNCLGARAEINIAC